VKPFLDAIVRSCLDTAQTLAVGLGLIFALTSPVAAQNTTADYIPFVHNGTTDFKTKFAPNVNSVYLSESQGINRDETQIAHQKSNHSLLKYKVFVPPGSKRLTLTMGTYLSDQESKITAALGKVPVLSASQVTAVEASKVDSSKILQSLSLGNEIQFYAPPKAGFVVMSQPLIDSTSTAFKTSLGQWIYVNVLAIPSNIIVDQFASLDVDQRCYRSWYAKAIRENLFDGSGNPIDTLNGVPYVHTADAADVAYCGGDAGGTTTSPLTGITLSSNVLTKGTQGTITITPTPSTASTLGCVPEYSGGATNLVSISGGNTISLAAGSNSISTTQIVTIRCGTVSAQFRIEPSNVAFASITLSHTSLFASDGTTVVTVTPNAGATLPNNCQAYLYLAGFDSALLTSYIVWTDPAVRNQFVLSANAKKDIVDVSEAISIDCGTRPAMKARFVIEVPLAVTQEISTDGKFDLTLKFKFKPPSLVGTPTARAFVVAYVPKNDLFKITSDSYYFLSKVTETTWKWTVLEGFDIDKLAFDHYSQLQASTDVVVPTGERIGDLNLLKATLLFYYQIGDGEFQNFGKIFSYSP
jgi:hypothetical protein